MKMTIRFCHLAYLPTWEPGDIIKRGDKIGKMGSTGASTNNHVHSDMVPGIHQEVYHLDEIIHMFRTPLEIFYALKQLRYFLDDEIFGVQIAITSSWGDPQYGRYKKDENGDYVLNENGNKILIWKFHPGFDYVPYDRHMTEAHFDMFWPRSKNGVCLSVGNDAGYGYYVNWLVDL